MHLIHALRNALHTTLTETLKRIVFPRSRLLQEQLPTAHNQHLNVSSSQKTYTSTSWPHSINTIVVPLNLSCLFSLFLFQSNACYAVTGLVYYRSRSRWDDLQHILQMFSTSNFVRFSSYHSLTVHNFLPWNLMVLVTAATLLYSQSVIYDRGFDTVMMEIIWCNMMHICYIGKT